LEFTENADCFSEPLGEMAKVQNSALNAEIKTTVAKIDPLRKDIDAILAEMEGGGVEA
jgi:type I restriction enzyme M protein